MASLGNAHKADVRGTKKRKVSEMESSKADPRLALISHPTVTHPAESSTQAKSVLVPRDPTRVTAEVPPSYLKLLRSRNELSLSRPVGKIEPTLTPLELKLPEFHTAIEAVMLASLKRRYSTKGAMRHADIVAETTKIASLTADVCMSALYHKLRTLHKSFGVYPARYTTSPTYTKDIELPLPFAIAIQEIGAFETHSLEDHLLIVPTYPENTKNEGRKADEFQAYKYQNYLPRIKEHGIPCKSINPHLKNGTAWWTYKATTVHKKNNLECILPPSHYSDLSAQLRAVFLHRKDVIGSVDQIVKLPEDCAVFATRLKEQTAGSNLRAFQALCHGYDEEWSQSAV